MRVWLDVVGCGDGKLLNAIAYSEEGRNRFSSLLWTARQGMCTVRMLHHLGIDARVVGQHAWSRVEKAGRLITRTHGLYQWLRTADKPDALICQSSVESVYLAFLLKIPSIILNDTLHATLVQRLQVPMATYHVAPRGTEGEWNTEPSTARVYYDGCNEVAYLLPLKNWLPEFVLVRMPETRADYYNEGTTNLESEAQNLRENGFPVKYLTRYDEFQDHHAFLERAMAVIGIGGTLNREAALHGIPSFVLPTNLGAFPNNTWLEELGYPLFHQPYDMIVESLFRLKENPRSRDPLVLQRQAESPIPHVIKILDGIKDD